MKLERLEVIHLRLPLVRAFETSFGRVQEKETILVRAQSEGLEGYGEAPAAKLPDYSAETVETVWHVIRDFLAPRLKGLEFGSLETVSDAFRFVRGHPMAKAGVIAAVADLLARQKDMPLWKMVGGSKSEIPTGISLGIEKTVDDLVEQVGKAVALGYQRIKLKIKPRWDTVPLGEVRRAHPDIRLMVDANGAYRLSDAEHLQDLDAFGLMMIEQPLDPDDLLDHAELAKGLKTPICLDESIRTPRLAEQALRIGACSIINIKAARVGGWAEAMRIHDVAQKAGADVWCGGLLESGVGRAHNIALATLPGFSLPGDISASARYYAEDIVDPPVEVTRSGTIRVPTGPGIGFVVNEGRLKSHLVRRQDVL